MFQLCTDLDTNGNNNNTVGSVINMNICVTSSPFDLGFLCVCWGNTVCHNFWKFSLPLLHTLLYCEIHLKKQLEVIFYPWKIAAMPKLLLRNNKIVNFRSPSLLLIYTWILTPHPWHQEKCVQSSGSQTEHRQRCATSPRCFSNCCFLNYLSKILINTSEKARCLNIK